MSDRRVVITGMSAITAAGIGKESNWSSLVKGESGINHLSSFNASSFPSQIAAEVKGFKAEEYIEDKRTINRLAKGDDYALVSAIMAIDDAGLTHENADFSRGGIYIGCGKEIGTPQNLFPAVAASLNADGQIDRRRFGVEAMQQTYPLFLVKDLPNAILFYISKQYKLQGINSNIVVGGTASSQAIGDAFHAIQHGDSDFIIAGGFDSRIDPINVSFLCNSGLLSSSNDKPKEACAPFDATRNGFVIGEGAGIIILEELGHALARGTHIYAELIGYAANSDLNEVMSQEKTGNSLALSIIKALQDANIEPQQIEYINANGDGTQSGDSSETLSIKKAFTKAAYQIPISSNKPVIGHLMAASGAAELVFTVMAIEDGIVPPTINYKNPDPSCDLDYVPNQARETKIKMALSINKCDISGRNTAIILKKFSKD